MGKNVECEMVAYPEHVLGRWKQYFEELLQEKLNKQREKSLHAAQQHINEPSLEDIMKNIQWMKNNKALGVDNI